METKFIDTSKKLFELNLKIKTDSIGIDVIWCRVIHKEGPWAVKRHFHSFPELHYVVKGTCRVSYDSEEYIADQGSMFMVSSGVYHEQQGGDGEFIKYVLSFEITPSPEDAEALIIAQAFSKLPTYPIAVDPYIHGLFKKMLEEATARKVGFLGNIKCIIQMILTLVARQLTQDCDLDYSFCLRPMSGDKWIEMVDEFINQHLSYHITVNEVARYVNLSRKHLNRIVREKRGISIHGLIAEAKLHQAKQLLKNSDYPLARIAEMLGFTNEFNFNRFFSKKEGLPPGLFRESLKRVKE
jgi:AraC-like DNA-binding protein/mannose-6-phosphate isomerase-like protein (cupin superfamily)